MTTIHDARVEVELENEIPVRLVRDGRIWQVIDQPTPLGNEAAIYSGLITHPPTTWSGWRFTARAEDGELLVFDIRRCGDGWDEIKVYR